MSLQSILSGVLAIYLGVSPCLIFDHHAHAESDNHDVAVEESHSHSHEHTHSHDHDTHHDESREHSLGDEHCCDDLTCTLHALAKEPPSSIGIVASVPSQLESVNIYDHVSLKVALSRDGPIFESAREFATITVIRV